MKKTSLLLWGFIIPFFVLGFLVLVYKSSLFQKDEVPSAASTTVQYEKQAEKPKVAHKSRVVKTLVTTGYGGNSTASVAYLLLENGQVVVYAPEGFRPPFTKQEAKTIMRAQMGYSVSVEAD